VVLAAKPVRRQAKLKVRMPRLVLWTVTPPILLRHKALVVSNQPSGWAPYMCLP